MDKALVNILRELECPVCNEYMHTVIPMCLRGHSLCAHCRTKCKHCPVCKEDFGKVRNYALEKVICNLKFPCKNKSEGCTSLANAIDITRHMDNCEKGNCQCPLEEFAQCTWTGKLTEVKTHLDKTHLVLKKMYTNEDTSVSVSFVTAFKSLFKIYRRQSDDAEVIEWAAQYIGAKSKAKNYKFKIDFNDKNEFTCDLMLSSTCDCIPICKDQEAFDKFHIEIPHAALTRFKIGNTFLHTLNIFPKK